MERLTRNFTEMEDGAEYTSCVQCDIRHICMQKDRYTKEAYTGGCFLMDIYKRLAAYEDTGLTPEEVPTAHEMAQIYIALSKKIRYIERWPARLTASANLPPPIKRDT